MHSMHHAYFRKKRISSRSWREYRENEERGFSLIDIQMMRCMGLKKFEFYKDGFAIKASFCIRTTGKMYSLIEKWIYIVSPNGRDNENKIVIYIRVSQLKFYSTKLINNWALEKDLHKICNQLLGWWILLK